MISLRMIDLADDGRISAADYRVMEKWWRVRAREAPPRNILPRLGVIASYGPGVPVAAAFAYLDAAGSGTAWLGWMVTDPSAPKATAGRAMMRALEFLEKECRRLDYWLGWATVNDPSFIRFLERRGYTRTDEGLCHLFKELPDDRRSAE
ncbi:hypothetical protein OVA24_16515 [Luteolibacter sp. SL250]|uniref:hypothetical protein n=1 Tax=Luteolibacter sp. SL250 TaxID=2995170 RepID=UPI0022711C8E|nr:hypothetical protein [Luteolibacter sp. SL250]WAC18835.1 hypothetical protein OVA24_16515 [Luteolibacter sp. SL250]